MKIKDMMAAVGPGILVAATGVGAGDLATGAIAGSKLGTTVLWAVLIGAAGKFVINEGIARWQLAAGETFLRSTLKAGGPVVRWIFGIYLLLWTYFVASALMSACGAAGQALIPISSDPKVGKAAWGLFHSLAGAALVMAGGYRLFERVMSAAIGLLFIGVVSTAFLLAPSMTEILSGLFVPAVARGGLTWTVALIGGVGGTLTVLCYGYWIEEEGRDSPGDLPACRVDLAVGYGVTALFGICMVIIGSRTPVDGGGTSLLLSLASHLEGPLGPWAAKLFLVGAWAAVASSLLGVWQSVPYVYVDLWKSSAKTLPPRLYGTVLWLMATLPAAGLWSSFTAVQRLYAVAGAMFMPVLALSLLVMGHDQKRLGALKNGPWVQAALASVLLFFLGAGLLKFL